MGAAPFACPLSVPADIHDRMNNDHADPGALDVLRAAFGFDRGHIWHVTDVGAMPFGARFGHTTAEPGFAGWVQHWAAGREWFDAV